MCLESVDHVLGVNWALLTSCTKKGNIWCLVYYTILILIFKLNRVSSLFSLPTFSSRYFTVTSKLNLIQVLESTAFLRGQSVLLQRAVREEAAEELQHKCLVGGIIIRAQPLAVGIPALPGPGFLLKAHPCAEPGQGATWRRPGERNTGRLDGLCHPRLLTHIYNA